MLQEGSNHFFICERRDLYSCRHSDLFVWARILRDGFLRVFFPLFFFKDPDYERAKEIVAHHFMEADEIKEATAGGSSAAVSSPSTTAVTQ